ncbi:hexamerin-like isoform X1 [Athalia rosae]|uniref:hexamerin-like isoform X1 n=1 Tax=Athalia rosae TaxID=37344 RepID=UPI0020333906|nr:hexamerin-like isoform X1 [Athalia rosae]
MSGLIISLLIGGIATYSHSAAVPVSDENPVEIAPEELVFKQKLVYELLQHVDQATVGNPELYKKGKSWDIKENSKLYDSEQVVNEFLEKYERGMLPRGRIFSVFYPVILEEAISLFRLFKSATNHDTFLKTAAWARIHVNEGQFIYAFSVAVVHRTDMKFVKLPPPYEINPHLFFNSETIRQAQIKKMTHVPHPSGVKLSYLLQTNESTWRTDYPNNFEERLNYFTEDVGLNAYFHILNLEYPFWMSSEEFNLPKGYRGEQYYYSLKLLLTRYNLERISNGLNKIEYIDWNKPLITGYHPSLTYPNGVQFPHRHRESHVPQDKYKQLQVRISFSNLFSFLFRMQTYSDVCIIERKIHQEIANLESRILGIIDSGYFVDVEGKTDSIYTSDGLDNLANIIEGNADSLNKQLYGSVDAVSRDILGFHPTPLNKHQTLPSAIQHFSTSLRDPIFYRLIDRIVGYFERYKSNMEPYTREQLGAGSGLKIGSLDIGDLETFIDHSDLVVDNAVAIGNFADGESIGIKARQHRLNHKPFTYTVNIIAEKPTPAMIRVFLGPKYEPISNRELDIADNYADFYEIDNWKVELKSGENEIKRADHEALFVLPDDEGADTFYWKVKESAETKIPFMYSKRMYGFPKRLLIPKGKKDGLPLRIFVHVAPCNDDHTSETDSPVWGKGITDGRPLGFPLDRPSTIENLTLPNIHWRDVVIFHKDVDEVNV